MKNTEHQGEDDDVSVLTTEQLARAEAIRIARGVLERRGVGGSFLNPGQIEPGRVFDLVSLASWIVTGSLPEVETDPKPIEHVWSKEFMDLISQNVSGADPGPVTEPAEPDEMAPDRIREREAFFTKLVEEQSMPEIGIKRGGVHHGRRIGRGPLQVLPDPDLRKQHVWGGTYGIGTDGPQ